MSDNSSVKIVISTDDQYSKGFDEAQKKAQSLDKAMLSLGTQSNDKYQQKIDALRSSYDLLAKSGKVTADELARAHTGMLAGIEAYSAKMSTVKMPSITDSAMSNLGMRSHADIAKDIDNLRGSYNLLAKSGNASMVELAQAKLKLINLTSDLNKETNGWVGSLMAAKESMVALGASLAVVGASVKKSIDFETSLADIGKVADFANTEALQAFGDELQKLSREIPLTVTDLAAMAEAGGQMGIATDQLSGFVQVAAKMATAFQMSGDEAGTSIGKLMTIFNMSVPQVEKLGDAINVLGNTTNAKEKDIITVLTSVGGIGQQFGLTAKELSALAASFLSLGKAPEVAGTAINALLGKLSTVNIQSDDFKNTLKTMGMSANDLADTIATNPTKALDDFLTKLQALPKQTQGNVIGKLFGVEYADDISALVKSMDAYRKNLAGVADDGKTAGSMQTEFSKRLQTTQANLDLMKNAFNEIAVNLGSTFLPAVRLVSQLLASLSQSIADLMKDDATIITLGASFLLLGSKMEIVQKLAATLGLVFARIGGATVAASIGEATAALAAVAVAGTNATRSIELLKTVMASLTFGNVAVAAAAAFAVIEAGGKAIEWVFEPAINRIKETETTLNSLKKAQKDWAALQTQAQSAGMSDAQLESIRQVKIETLNTQGVLTQAAAFDSQRNQQAMAEVKAQIDERMRLRDLLAAKVQDKATAEAALEKAKQEEITQARTKALQDAKTKLDDFINAKKRALDDEENKEKSAIDKIKALRQQLAQQLQSDSDRMRELSRRDMSEEQQQADIAAQAAEKMQAAKTALSAGDGEGASKLANDAKSLAERLKDSTQAMDTFKQASNLDAQANQLQQYQERLKVKDAQQQQVKINADITAAQAQVDILDGQIAAATKDPKVVQMEADIANATSGIASVQAQLDALQDKTITVTVNEVNNSTQARRWGGFITDNSGNIPRFATGGKLPGYGGGDKIHALLEAGEFIVRKEAVARYGAGAMHAINNLRLPKFQNGGMVGGDVSRTGNNGSDLVNIKLDLGGGRIVPFTTKREQVQSIKDAFAFIERGGFA